jgi:hypothetical protein
MNTITTPRPFIKQLEPIHYTYEVRRAGFLCWYWVVESKFAQTHGGPFMTRRAAVRALSAITGKMHE